PISHAAASSCTCRPLELHSFPTRRSSDLLTNVIGLANTAPKGEVAPTVTWAFYIGASALFLTVLWTVIRTKEYAPEEYNRYKGRSEEHTSELQSRENLVCRLLLEKKNTTN